MKIIIVLAAAAVVCCVLVVLYCIDPIRSNLYAPCPFYALTGFYCPGCGSLRALHQLLHGHYTAALDLNPLMVLSLPFLVFALISHALHRRGGCFSVRPPARAFWIWSLLGVIIAFWIFRNIPVYPFSVLAP